MCVYLLPPPTLVHRSTAPPSRPPFGGASVMTSPGGTPLSSRNIIPITGLNPYQNRWTIKVRVSSKPAIRTWSNSRGEGKVFNVDLVDSSVSVCVGGRERRVHVLEWCILICTCTRTIRVQLHVILCDDDTVSALQAYHEFCLSL